MTDQKYMNMVNVLRANGIIKGPKNFIPGIKDPKKPKNEVASIYKPDEEMERLNLFLSLFLHILKIKPIFKLIYIFYFYIKKEENVNR